METGQVGDQGEDRATHGPGNLETVNYYVFMYEWKLGIIPTQSVLLLPNIARLMNRDKPKLGRTHPPAEGPLVQCAHQQAKAQRKARWLFTPHFGDERRCQTSKLPLVLLLPQMKAQTGPYQPNHTRRVCPRTWWYYCPRVPKEYFKQQYLHRPSEPSVSPMGRAARSKQK